MAYDPQENRKASAPKMEKRRYEDGDAQDGEPMTGSDFGGMTMASPVAHILGLAERLAENAINPADFLQRIQHDLGEQNGVLQNQHSEIEDAQRRVSEEEQRLIKLRLRTEAEIEMVHVAAQEIAEQLKLYRQSQERLDKSFG